MYAKKVVMLLLVCLFFGGHSFGQSGENIEHLLGELKNTQASPGRVDILVKLSIAHWNVDPVKARGFADQGLQLARKLNYQKGVIRSFNSIGAIYRRSGDYHRALECYYKILRMCEKMGLKKGVGSVYNNIGIIYKNQGNYSRALEYYFKTLQIFEELGLKRGIGSIYNNIGNIYSELGNRSQALIYYLKSVKIREELGLENKLGLTFINIGLIYQAQGNDMRALEYQFKSRGIAEGQGDKRGLASAYINIGYSYQRRGNYSRALKHYFKSRDISREIGAKQLLSSALHYIGECYKERKEYKKAVRNLTAALEIARSIDEPERIKNAAQGLSEAYAKIGRYELAYQYHLLFKEKSDFLRNEDNAKKITRLEMQYQFDKQQKQKELELREKDLKKEAELKQQRILKYVFSGVAIMLALVFYTRYRLKVKVNRRLKKEIHDREKAEAELVKSAKLEAVGILSAGIAHDFNNLLSVITGNLEMAKLSLEDPEPKPVPFIESAEKATNQSADLVKKFLTISEGGWMQRTQVQLRDIIEESRNAFPMSRKTALDITLTETLKPLYGDERQLRQVMDNLLVNAHEATAALGSKREIMVAAKPVTLQADNQWSLAEGEYVHLSVSDNGGGIPEDVRAKIFDPYFSTKEIGSQKGMGMGLAVCHAIVQRHGGHIAVTSGPEQGTTFDVYLPVNSEQ